MNLIDVYDPKKIIIPTTDAEFWLALQRVERHYMTDACWDYGKRFPLDLADQSHIWFTWLHLNFWLDQAFQEWRMAK